MFGGLHRLPLLYHVHVYSIQSLISKNDGQIFVDADFDAIVFKGILAFSQYRGKIEIQKVLPINRRLVRAKCFSHSLTADLAGGRSFLCLVSFFSNSVSEAETGDGKADNRNQI